MGGLLTKLHRVRQKDLNCNSHAWEIIDEVLATLRVALNAGSWTLRRHAALAMHSLAKERRVSAKSAEELVGVCIAAIAGKAWNGKDAVYDAASALSLSAAPLSSISGASLEDSAPHKALAAALWKEATRGEKKMRTAALSALSEVLKHRTPRSASLYGDMRAAMAANLCAAPEHTGDTAEAIGRHATFALGISNLPQRSVQNR